MRIPSLLLMLGLAFALAEGSGAGTALVPAARDATLIESADGSLANGAGPALFAGRTSQSAFARRRALLYFDLAGHVPPGAVVSDARLVLTLTPSNAVPAELTLHRVTTAWSEGPAASEGGGGAAAGAGDATWLDADFEQSPWTSPGGDFAAAPSAAEIVGGSGRIVFGGASLADDVQDWLDAPERNHGWILIGDEDVSTSAKRFAARESSDPAARPLLEIEFGRRLGTCADVPLAPEPLALCTGFCEVLDCDSLAPRGSARACERLAARFAAASGAAPPCTIPDRDADGVGDEDDNCAAVSNPAQEDRDADGAGDACDNCPDEPNPAQEDSFGAAGVGDACDCPCFTAESAFALGSALQNGADYDDLLCIDTRVTKPLTALTARRNDGAPCSLASEDCSALAVEFTEDRACQWNPPAPSPPRAVSGISDPQRMACRAAILSAADALGLPCN